MNRDIGEYKDQLRTLNENLKRQTEVAVIREREASSVT